MTDTFVVNVLGAFISGVFSLLAASVPHYLQRRKSASQIVQEISDQQIYHMWPWYFAYGICLILLFQFVYILIVLYGTVIGMLIVAAQTEDMQNFVATFDSRKSATMAKFLQGFDQYISTTVNSIVVLFVSKYCSHRFGKHALIKVIVAAFAATAIWAIALWFVRDRGITTDTDVLRYFVIGVPLCLLAAYVGYVWAKKSHTKFLVGYVCERLAENDRLALLDLALTQRRSDEHQIKT